MKKILKSLTIILLMLFVACSPTYETTTETKNQAINSNESLITEIIEELFKDIALDFETGNDFVLSEYFTDSKELETDEEYFITKQEYQRTMYDNSNTKFEYYVNETTIRSIEIEEDSARAVVYDLVTYFDENGNGMESSVGIEYEIQLVLENDSWKIRKIYAPNEDFDIVFYHDRSTLDKIEDKPEIEQPDLDLSNTVKFSTLVDLNSIKIDIININYRQNITDVTFEDEIEEVIDNLKVLNVIESENDYKNSEHYYTFELVNLEGDNLLFSIDNTGSWIGYDDIYYDIIGQSNLDDLSILGINVSFGTTITGETADFYNKIQDVMSHNVVKAIARWSHYPKIQYWTDNYDSEDFLAGIGMKEIELDSKDYRHKLLTLRNADFELLYEYPIANNDSNVTFEYNNGHKIILSADDKELYISLYYYGYWFYGKVLSPDLHEYVFSFSDEIKSQVRTLDCLKDTKKITIEYVKEKDTKDFPENGKVSTFVIDDEQTIAEIIDTVYNDWNTVETSRPHFNADIIFHTGDGDYYGKIMFPQYDERCEVIFEGYLWYKSNELYNILQSLNK